MSGMAATLFLYGASGLVAPWYVVALLLLAWVGMFIQACRWWTPHPTWISGLAIVAAVIWFATLVLGSLAFDWQS